MFDWMTKLPVCLKRSHFSRIKLLYKTLTNAFSVGSVFNRSYYNYKSDKTKHIFVIHVTSQQIETFQLISFHECCRLWVPTNKTFLGVEIRRYVPRIILHRSPKFLNKIPNCTDVWCSVPQAVLFTKSPYRQVSAVQACWIGHGSFTKPRISSEIRNQPNVK